MKYKVLVTETAQEDLESIADYLINKLLAGETALKQTDRIERAVLSLEEMPERYHVYDKEPWKEKRLRVMRVDNYLVFYIIDDGNKSVIVVRVMYGKRDIEMQLPKSDRLNR